MKRFKNILKCFSIGIIFFIFLVLLFTFINYFQLFDDNVIMIFKYIIPIISLVFCGFLVGKRSLKNGWLEGFLFSLCFVSVMLIITIFLNKFKLNYFLYLLILIISGILGSMFGISRKN